MKTTVPFVLISDGARIVPRFEQFPIKQDFETAIAEGYFDGGSPRVYLDFGILKLGISRGAKTSQYYLSHLSSLDEPKSDYLVEGFNDFEDAIITAKDLVAQEAVKLSAMLRYLERVIG